MLPVAIMCNNRTAVTELFQRDQQITILYMFRFTPSRSTSFYSIPKKKIPLLTFSQSTSKALHQPNGRWTLTSNKFAESNDVWRGLRGPDLKEFLDCPHYTPTPSRKVKDDYISAPGRFLLFS